MNRTEKEQEVQRLGEFFKNSNFTVLADYCGLTVKDVTDLRRSLREANTEMKVVKNTLAQIAVRDSEMKVLVEHFVGSTAVFSSQGDPVNAAKILVKFAKQFEKLKLKVGFFSGNLLSDQQVEALSKLPSREQLLSSLLGSMSAPAQNMVNLLVAVPRQMATVLAAIRDKKSA